MRPTGPRQRCRYHSMGSGRSRCRGFTQAAFIFPVVYMASEAMIVDRKTISIMKACELVGVSRRTIYNWISSGKVEYVRTAGGSIRIFTDTLWREPAGVSKGPVWPQADRKEA